MKKLIVSLLACTSIIYGMDQKKAQEQRLHVLAIPGQNGMGSKPWYVQNLLGADNVDVEAVATPMITADLGQGFCMRHLRNAVAATKSSSSIVHATSQGTATALNYVGLEDKGKHIKGLILESVLASGNSAIHHTVTGPAMELPVDKIPFSYYWLPYPAGIVACPSYIPAGKQAITSIEHIPTDTVIIIAHSKGDIQLPFTGACALYYGFKERGNKNVYFVTKEDSDHIHILNLHSDSPDRDVVQTILRKHKFLPADEKAKHEMDLTPYQPDHKPFKRDYETLMGKEKNHKHLAYALTVGALYTLYYASMRYLGQ